MANEQRFIDANAYAESWRQIPDEYESYTARQVIEDIISFPTVDAVEVVYGQNIVNEDDEWYGQVNQCSICGCNWMMYDEDDLHYCPKCCAKLDERRE